MIASFHVVEYRRAVVSPPKRLAGRICGLRFWRPFNVGGDFAYFREHPTRRALYPRLRPDFHRWAFYGVWEDDAALGEFMAGSNEAATWHEAREAWHLRLRPLKAKGSWPGTSVLASVPPTPASAATGPVAHLVRLDLSLRGTLAMWATAAPHVLRFLPDSDELLVGLPLVDRPYTQPVSFSLWRSAEAARSFARGREGHATSVATVRRWQPNLAECHATASFVPYHAAGTLNGCKPLAEFAATT
jgi:hypothetical protein